MNWLKPWDGGYAGKREADIEALAAAKKQLAKMTLERNMARNSLSLAKARERHVQYRAWNEGYNARVREERSVELWSSRNPYATEAEEHGGQLASMVIDGVPIPPGTSVVVNQTDSPEYIHPMWCAGHHTGPCRRGTTGGGKERG